MEVNIQNTEGSLVYLSFPLLGRPLKKGSKKKKSKMRKMRNMKWLPGRLGFFFSERRWLWESMMETNKIMDSLFINHISLVIAIKDKSQLLTLANEDTLENQMESI